jgi:deoxyadenosine/deoxycytidine kinase
MVRLSLENEDMLAALVKNGKELEKQQRKNEKVFKKLDKTFNSFFKKFLK